MSAASNTGSSACVDLPDDLGQGLVPLNELDLDSFDLEPFGGSASLLVFCFFNPWFDPAGGSLSLSSSLRSLFKE
ncbi:hypothetical protein Tco_0621305, partial [Tanacetum coccineum]